VIAAALLAVSIAATSPGAATGAHEPIRFESLAWDATREDVARSLAARHYVREAAAEPGDEAVWSGRAFGRHVHVTPEFDANGVLIALNVRVDADERGSALQRYLELVAAMRRRHGPWTAQVEPGRPVTEERIDREGRLRRYGDRTAATLWVGADDAAAAVQLGRDDSLWLRYESPRWNALHPDEAGDDDQR